jgi:hypothetical protein
MKNKDTLQVKNAENNKGMAVKNKSNSSSRIFIWELSLWYKRNKNFKKTVGKDFSMTS